jgi:Holliday junction resolvase
MAQEKAFENKIKKFLESRGAWRVKYFANAYTEKGVPDILACVNGYFVGVEVKSDNGKLSDVQLAQIKKINDAGGFAFALYPSKFGDFKIFIDDLLNDNFERNKIPTIWK